MSKGIARMKLGMRAALILLLSTVPMFANSDASKEPRNATYCEISRDPAAYNHQILRLTGFVTHGFEDFEISEPNCPTQGFSIWLMYGGKAESGTVYCCPGEGGRDSRSKVLTIDGVELPLEDDQVFQRFRNLLQQVRDTTVRGTFVGTFFSGNKESRNELTYWSGYGHMGCCSLLVLQRIESFEPHDRTDLDYTAESGWYESEGCKWGTEKDLRSVLVNYSKEEAQNAIADQKKAESDRGWAFTDPQRVAVESLKTFFPKESPVLRRVKSTPSRNVYQWRKGKTSIVVVVTRPYWLSHYASSHSVAWTATMIKEAQCR